MMRIHSSSVCNVRYIFIAIAMVLYNLYNFYLCERVVAAGVAALINSRTSDKPSEPAVFSVTVRSKANGVVTYVNSERVREVLSNNAVLFLEMMGNCELAVKDLKIDVNAMPFIMIKSLEGNVDSYYVLLAKLLWYYEKAMPKDLSDVSVEVVRKFVEQIGPVAQYEVIVVSGENHAKMRAMSETVIKTLDLAKKSTRMTKQQVITKIKKDAENIDVQFVYKPIVLDVENTDISFSHPQLLDRRVLNILRALGPVPYAKSNTSLVQIEDSYIIVIVLQKYPEKKSIDLPMARVLCRHGYLESQAQKLINVAKMNFLPQVEEKGIVCDGTVYEWEVLACLLNIMMSADTHETILASTMREEMVKNPELFAKSLEPICNIIAVSHYGRQGKANISEEELNLRGARLQFSVMCGDERKIQEAYEAMPLLPTAAYKAHLVVSRNKQLLESLCKSVNELDQKASQNGLDLNARTRAKIAHCSHYLEQHVGEAMSKNEWMWPEIYNPMMMLAVENAEVGHFSEHPLEFNKGVYCAYMVLEVQGPGKKCPKDEIREKIQRFIASRKMKEWIERFLDKYDLIVTKQ